jgi:hypothetical protein
MGEAMTSIEAAFVAYITAQSTVTDLVGTRVYQDLMPQKAAYPAIVYSLVGEARDDGYSFGTTANGQVEARLQVAAWATTSVAARAVHDAVRRLVNGFKGTWGENTIQSVFIDSTESAVDVEPGNDAARLFGYRTDLLVTFEQLENEVQLVTFSTAPVYGKGTFYGPQGEPAEVDFSANLATEQAVFDAAMPSKSPTVSRPTSLTHKFTFSTGVYAATNLAQMTFTANTTTFPLNDGTSTATLVKTQEGDAGMVIPTIYTLTWVGAAGWVTISGTDFVRGSLPATAVLGGFDWDIAGSGATFTLTTGQFTNATLTLDASKVGAAVTGTMSTPIQGG